MNASFRLFSRSSAPPNLAPTLSVSLAISMSSLCAFQKLDIAHSTILAFSYPSLEQSSLSSSLISSSVGFSPRALQWQKLLQTRIQGFDLDSWGWRQPENIPKLVFTQASLFSFFAKHLKHFGHCLCLLGLWDDSHRSSMTFCPNSHWGWGRLKPSWQSSPCAWPPHLSKTTQAPHQAGGKGNKTKFVVGYQMVSSLLSFLGKHLKYKAEGVTGKMNDCRFYGEWLRHAM